MNGQKIFTGQEIADMAEANATLAAFLPIRVAWLFSLLNRYHSLPR